MEDFPVTPGPVDRRIGARVRARRVLLGVTLDALAEALASPANLIEDYEAGRRRMGALVLMRLTDILKVEVGYFLGGLMDDAPPPAEVERLFRDNLIPR